MISRNKIYSALVLCFSLSIGQAHATGIPVIDVANLANSVENLVQWGKQIAAMKQQYDQQVQQYNSLNGVRGMANLVNNPALRQYLPANYKDILSNGYGSWQSIRNDGKVLGIGDTSLDPLSQSGKSFESTARQLAINKAVVEDAYRKASDRFTDMQVLLDKINDSPDQKDIQDLQARIQAEQLMMQNEQIKLQMLTQLQLAQKDLDAQAAKERAIQFTHAPKPGHW